jgi:hypothetical protein
MKLWQRRTLALLAIGGGGVAWALSWSVLPGQKLMGWILGVGFGAIYGWGMWTGVKLLEQRPGAERSMRRFWMVQIPVLSSPMIGYKLISGFHLTIYLQLAPAFKVGAHFDLGGTFQYSLLQAGEPFIIGVNVFALGIVIWLNQLYPKHAPALVPQAGA